MNAISDLYQVVMNAEKNPLRHLPRAQRFQVMAMLSVMWSIIFSVGIGTWAWFGELVAFHLLFLAGVAITAWTFSSTRQLTPRDRYQRVDGTVSHDDLWGG